MFHQGLTDQRIDYLCPLVLGPVCPEQMVHPTWLVSYKDRYIGKLARADLFCSVQKSWGDESRLLKTKRVDGVDLYEVASYGRGVFSYDEMDIKVLELFRIVQRISLALTLTLTLVSI